MQPSAPGPRIAAGGGPSVPADGPTAAPSNEPAPSEPAPSPPAADAPTAGERSPDAPRSHGRAGRNLGAAIAVGLGLGVLITVPLYAWRPGFVAVVALAAGVGSAELADALRRGRGVHVPVVPLSVGAVVAVVAAYRRGSEALVLVVLLTALVSVGWAAVGGARERELVEQVSASLLITGYVPLLTGFAALLAVPPDGPRRVTAFIATTVCNDVGGYAAGVLFGRHPLAPSVSPKKTWEGLAGSLAACLLAGGIFLGGLLHRPVWFGLLYGAAVVASATVGDLAESVLKRDLNVKDMGRLLPGHGGLMERLDSLLITAPVAWLLLSALAPLPTPG